MKTKSFVNAMRVCVFLVWFGFFAVLCFCVSHKKQKKKGWKFSGSGCLAGRPRYGEQNSHFFVFIIKYHFLHPTFLKKKI